MSLKSRIKKELYVQAVEKNIRGKHVLDESVVREDAAVFDGGVVAQNAVVEGKAWVHDGGIVRGNANVSGRARIFDGGIVEGGATVSGNSEVGRGIVVRGDARLSRDAYFEMPDLSFIGRDLYHEGTMVVTGGNWPVDANREGSGQHIRFVVGEYDGQEGVLLEEYLKETAPDHDLTSDFRVWRA